MVEGCRASKRALGCQKLSDSQKGNEYLRGHREYRNPYNCEKDTKES